MDDAVLQRADHLEPSPIADVGEPRVLVTTEVALEDAAVARAIEHGAPRLELAHAIGRLARVQLGHAPVVHVLPAAHRIREVHAPGVALVHVGERRRNASLRHHGMRLPEQRLADEPNGDTGRCRFDRRPKPGTTSPNDEHVVVEPLMTYSH